eukprot:Platyproteum_vivax@DN10280_c0_g1_i1.p1
MVHPPPPPPPPPRAPPPPPRVQAIDKLPRWTTNKTPSNKPGPSTQMGDHLESNPIPKIPPPKIVRPSETGDGPSTPCIVSGVSFPPPPPPKEDNKSQTTPADPQVLSASVPPPPPPPLRANDTTVHSHNPQANNSLILDPLTGFRPRPPQTEPPRHFGFSFKRSADDAGLFFPEASTPHKLPLMTNGASPLNSIHGQSLEDRLIEARRRSYRGVVLPRDLGFGDNGLVASYYQNTDMYPVERRRMYDRFAGEADDITHRRARGLMTGRRMGDHPPVEFPPMLPPQYQTMRLPPRVSTMPPRPPPHPTMHYRIEPL